MAIPFLTLLLAFAAAAPGKVAFYAATGPEFTQYEVNIEAATLTKRSTVLCPAGIQYVWPHPSRRYLYVAWSDGGPSGAAGAPTGGSKHGVSAFRIDAASGALLPLGNPLALPSRPVHISTDIPGTHLLVAHTIPSALTVYRIGADGALGAAVNEPAGLDAGIYAHQVRVDPSNRAVILVTRGNGPTKDKPEDPGALKVYSYKDGTLANKKSVAPGGGFNFQPRHLDYHPSKPWVFVSLERQNKLQVYKKSADGLLAAAPLFTVESLVDPSHAGSGQAAGTVHVHPNGKIVYQANRGDENSIAVYSVDPKSGEPRRIQNIDTHGMSPRTFSLDPDARLLVAGNQVPSGATPASMAVYRIQPDGKLEYVRKYDVEATNARSLFWLGFIPLP
jgi:6-phosphogluconolactonase (cycloisomerase 2 family)